MRPPGTRTLEYKTLSTIKDYYEVTKPRVVALMIFTVLVGMFMATRGVLPWPTVLFAILGITLLAAAAAAINHVSDRRIDAMMSRTSQRPLPAGRLSRAQVMWFAGLTGSVGTFLLLAFVNVLTAVLAVLSLLGYALVYTRYLKFATPQNIVIGGAAGATPPLLGWTAVTGQIEPGGIILFLIIYVWTPPHFWALALYKKDEYKKAGVPMLPVTHSDDFTRLHILLYSILLFCVSLLPYLLGMSGAVYLWGAVFLGAGFLYYTVSLKVTRSRRKAIGTFQYSIVYLTLLFALLLIDVQI